MYAEYLFSLAHVCHLGAAEVQALTLAEFANYTDAIDAYVEAMRRKE